MMSRSLYMVAATFAVIIGFTLLIFFFYLLKPTAEKIEPQVFPVAVLTSEARQENVNLVVTSQGEVRPQTEIDVTLQVSGKVVRIADNFRDGGRIYKGEELLAIEAIDYELALTQARVSLAQADQALKTVQAEATLAREDWEELIGATREQKPSALALFKPQLAQAQASYDAALADVKRAELQLHRTRIVAPFDGRVRSTMADIGQFVTAGSPIAQIFSTNIAEIRLPLSSEDLARLDLQRIFAAGENGQKGPQVTFKAEIAGTIRHWQGHIARTDASIDPGTGQISAIAQVDDPYGAGVDQGFPLTVGLFVVAEIEGSSIGMAIKIPRTALQENNTVYRVDSNNIVHTVTVEVAALTAQDAIITQGLMAGDRVIISRPNNFKAGDTVTPLDPNQPLATRNDATTLSEDETLSPDLATDRTPSRSAP